MKNLLFFERLDRFDNIIRKGPGNSDYSTELKPLLLEDVSIAYFYEEISKTHNPKWLDFFCENEEFKKIPQKIPAKEKDTWIIPRWSLTSILLRNMVQDDENKVVEIMENVIPRNDNIWILQDYIEIALVTNPTNTKKLSSRICEWISVGNYPIMMDQLGQLISKLSKNNFYYEAYTLTNDLLNSSQESSARMRNLDYWHFETIVKGPICSDLFVRQPKKTLDLLCNTLINYICLETKNTESKHSIYDYSNLWRPAVEDHEQNRDTSDKKSLLAASIRDLATEILQETHDPRVITELEERPYKIFQRIGIYLRSQFLDLMQPSTEKLVLKQNILNDVSLRHEYFYLLRNHFKNFSKTTQKQYLGYFADSNFSQEWHMLHFPKEDFDCNESKEKFERWRYKYLSPISSFLAEPWDEIYTNVVAKFGENKHVDFPVFTSGPHWGYKSPKTVKELMSMDTEGLKKYIENWKPSDELLSSSYEGLERTLTNVFKQGEFVIPDLLLFSELKPFYLRGILRGLSEAGDQKIMNWHKLFSFIKSILDKENEYFDEDPTLREYPGASSKSLTYIEIARLIENLFDRKENLIPLGFKDDIWNILIRLSEDKESPSVSSEKEDLLGKYPSDSLTLSLNTVRGIAMRCVLIYISWLYENRDEEQFLIPAETKEFLEQRLDLANEPSVIVHSVYGEYFDFLFRVDRELFKSIMSIIQLSEGFEGHRQAIFDSYLQTNSPSFSIFPFLEFVYWETLRYCQSIRDQGGNEELSNVEKRLIEHILMLYWWGTFDERSMCLHHEIFFGEYDQRYRDYAMDFVGRSLKRIKEEMPEDVKKRLQTLIKERLSIFRYQNKPKTMIRELSLFGKWFASEKFNYEWSINLLFNITSDIQLIERPKQVLSVMNKNLPKFFSKVIHIVENIVCYDEDPSNLIYYRDVLKDMIEKLCSLAQEKEDLLALNRVVNGLGGKGELDLRDFHYRLIKKILE